MTEGMRNDGILYGPPSTDDIKPLFNLVDSTITNLKLNVEGIDTRTTEISYDNSGNLIYRSRCVVLYGGELVFSDWSDWHQVKAWYEIP